MENLLQSGLHLIVAVQQVHGPVLDSLFLTITSVGAEEFYLLLIPVLFWCVDLGLGARIGFFLLFSGYLNTYLKDLFQQPRPFDLEPSVQLAPAEGYGLPSGHAQSAVVAWGSLAAWSRKRWLWGLAIALVVLIGFSRVYLGVHFPTDVLAAWVIGGAALGLYLALQARITKWLARLGLARQMLLALVVPLVLLLIHPVEDTAMTMGALSGAAVGLTLTHRYIPFSAQGPPSQRLLRFLLGIVIVVLLYGGLKMAFPGEESTLDLVFRTIRFGSIGLWSSLGAPWLFVRLGLTPETENLG